MPEVNFGPVIGRYHDMPAEVHLPLIGEKKVMHYDQNGWANRGPFPLGVIRESQLRMFCGKPGGKFG